MRVKIKRVHRFTMPSYLILNKYIQEIKKEKPLVKDIEKGQRIDLRV